MGDFLVPAWLYIFRAPRSYSGEDLVEMHVPGNPIIARRLLDVLMKAGARAADPGEFTARALFNGRMDLSAAEGVAAVIAAASERELRAARQLMAGQLAQRVRPIMDEVAGTLALVEVGIDFSDEDVTVLAESDLRTRVEHLAGELDDLLHGTSRFERLRHEPRVVLVGRPNAGKSTLLNVLAGSARAVVSDVAGTTRDALSASVVLPRGRVQLVDLAGLTVDAAPGTDRAIAADMQRRAREELESADVVLLVHDSTDSSPPLALPRPPDLIVYSKSDLAGSRTGDLARRDSTEDGRGRPSYNLGELSVSAHRGDGLAALCDRLDELCFGGPASPALALNSRHVRAIEAALLSLGHIAQVAQPELVALHLRDALDQLGTIVGQVSPDEIIGQVFSRFCIGK